MTHWIERVTIPGFSSVGVWTNNAGQSTDSAGGSLVIALQSKTAPAPQWATGPSRDGPGSAFVGSSRREGGVPGRGTGQGGVSGIPIQEEECPIRLPVLLDEGGPSLPPRRWLRAQGPSAVLRKPYRHPSSLNTAPPTPMGPASVSTCRRSSTTSPPAVRRSPMLPGFPPSWAWPCVRRSAAAKSRWVSRQDPHPGR